jgi:hypothetical protein
MDSVEKINFLSYFVAGVKSFAFHRLTYANQFNTATLADKKMPSVAADQTCGSSLVIRHAAFNTE